jgi:hypothetical protein
MWESYEHVRHMSTDNPLLPTAEARPRDRRTLLREANGKSPVLIFARLGEPSRARTPGGEVGWHRCFSTADNIDHHE